MVRILIIQYFDFDKNLFKNVLEIKKNLHNFVARC